ncbi:DUF4291 family protein [Xanthomonas sacchari]
MPFDDADGQLDPEGSQRRPHGGKHLRADAPAVEASALTGGVTAGVPIQANASRGIRPARGDAAADRRRCCDDVGCATLHPLPCAALQLTWPRQGRHILSCFDTDAIDVYQVDRPAIARFAMDHQRFGGEFSYHRMSWIKPNFLWLMSRAGWARKQ